MKKILLFIMCCTLLVGCNKTEEVPQQNSTPQEQLTESLPEDVGEVTYEIDGEEVTEEEFVNDIGVEVEEETESSVTDVLENHITVEGGESIDVTLDVEVLKDVQFEHILYEEDKILQTTIQYPEELTDIYASIDMTRENGVWDINDIYPCFYYRNLSPRVVNLDSTAAYWCYAPLADAEHVRFISKAGIGPYEVEGSYKELERNPDFASCVFLEYEITTHGVVYRVSAPITEEVYKTKYEPYCTVVGEDDFGTGRMVLLNNLKGCKGSLTVFEDIGNGYVLPVSLGNTEEPLTTNETEIYSMANTIADFMMIESMNPEGLFPY